jgi:hypothetical protein
MDFLLCGSAVFVSPRLARELISFWMRELCMSQRSHSDSLHDPNVSACYFQAVSCQIACLEARHARSILPVQALPNLGISPSPSRYTDPYTRYPFQRTHQRHPRTAQHPLPWITLPSVDPVQCPQTETPIGAHGPDVAHARSPCVTTNAPGNALGSMALLRLISV